MRVVSLSLSHLEFMVEGFLKALSLFTLYDTDILCTITFHGVSASLFSTTWSVDRERTSLWLFQNRNNRTPCYHVLHGAGNQTSEKMCACLCTKASRESFCFVCVTFYLFSCLLNCPASERCRGDTV